MKKENQIKFIFLFIICNERPSIKNKTIPESPKTPKIAEGCKKRGKNVKKRAGGFQGNPVSKKLLMYSKSHKKIGKI